MTNNTDKSILTNEGKALLARLNAEENAFVLDKMIFANVPNREEYPQPGDEVPSDYVVHEEPIEQRGRLSEDSVIYSATLNSGDGPFEFNWTGTYCSEYGVLVTINHHSLTPKTADEPGVPGNTLVRSIVLEYKNVAELTNITVDASTWQYNANPRMLKMDDDAAQANIDQNGKDWFIEDGFLVTPQPNAFNIKAGAGYVSGNRVVLEFDRNVQIPNKPSFIYVDAHREGTPTGEQNTLFDFVVTADEKEDYTDESGVKHFVCKIAQVLDGGSVSDLRPEGEKASNEFVKARTLKSLSLDANADSTGQEDATESFEVADDFFVPNGFYKSQGGSKFPAGNYLFSPSAYLEDQDTKLPFKPCHDGKLQHLSDAYFDRMSRTFTGWEPKIVCFGDSNTRYYEGEDGGAGPVCKSYGQILSVLCGHYPATFGADVIVSGHPGYKASWGADEIANHVDDNADIVVLGFGTNDVKLSAATEESELVTYLDNMKSMIKHVISNGSTPIVLAIPWFSESYGHHNGLSQKIIKVWNSHLYNLCKWANVAFVDTYNLTRKHSDVYFNETKLQRHYSQAATKAIAERIMVEIIDVAQSSQMRGYVYNTFDFMPYVRGGVEGLTKEQFSLGHERFEVLKIPNGESLVLATHGLTCLGFYPRRTAKALIQIENKVVEFQVSNETDKGLYYPIQRCCVGNPSLMGAGDSLVTVSASEGDLYLRYITFESAPFTESSTLGGEKLKIYADVSGSDMPTVIDGAVIYRIEELTGMPAYNIGNQWFGYDGLYCLGTTEMMNSVLSVGAANGKKFYNTDERKGKRLFDGEWINL